MMEVKLRAMPRWIPLLLTLMSGATCGMLLYPWSVFIRPLTVEFAWNRADIALAFSICSLVFGLTAFVSGRLCARIGARNMVIAGGIILGMGFFMSGFVHSKLQLYLTYGLMAGCGGGLIYLPPVAAAIKWWPDRPVMASWFPGFGLGLGVVIMAPLATWLIARPDYGWRYVFWYCGAAMGLMAFISGLLLTSPPKGWMPESWTPTASEATSSLPKSTLADKETARDSSVWFFYTACYCYLFAGLMVIGHMADLAINQGLNAMAAAGAVSLLALAAVASRFLSGYFVEKISLKVSLACLFVLQTSGMVLLYPAGSSLAALYIVAALIGWSYGAMINMLSPTGLQCGGPGAHDSSSGILFIIWALAGFTGPWTGGLLRDSTGDHYISFICGAIVSAIGGLIISTIKMSPRGKIT